MLQFNQSIDKKRPPLLHGKPGIETSEVYADLLYVLLIAEPFLPEMYGCKQERF
jgi:hypothetical protein